MTKKGKTRKDNLIFILSPPVFVVAVIAFPPNELRNVKICISIWQPSPSKAITTCSPPQHRVSFNSQLGFVKALQQCNCGFPLHHYGGSFRRPVYKRNKQLHKTSGAAEEALSGSSQNLKSVRKEAARKSSGS